jgi:hypothetical protein
VFFNEECHCHKVSNICSHDACSGVCFFVNLKAKSPKTASADAIASIRRSFHAANHISSFTFFLFHVPCFVLSCFLGVRPDRHNCVFREEWVAHPWTVVLTAAMAAEDKNI